MSTTSSVSTQSYLLISLASNQQLAAAASFTITYLKKWVAMQGLTIHSKATRQIQPISNTFWLTINLICKIKSKKSCTLNHQICFMSPQQQVWFLSPKQQIWFLSKAHLQMLKLVRSICSLKRKNSCWCRHPIPTSLEWFQSKFL